MDQQVKLIYSTTPQDNGHLDDSKNSLVWVKDDQDGVVAKPYRMDAQDVPNSVKEFLHENKSDKQILIHITLKDHLLSIPETSIF
jgi:hypothetical protein